MGRYSGIDEVDSGLIRKLNQWWDSKRGDDIPLKDDVELSHLPEILSYLLVSRIERDASGHSWRVRYEWVGRRVHEVTGIDLTGAYLDDIAPGQTEEPWLEYYRAAFDTRAPVFGEVIVPTKSGGSFMYEFVIYPARDAAGEISGFVSLEDYFDLGEHIADIVPWHT